MATLFEKEVPVFVEDRKPFLLVTISGNFGRSFNIQVTDEKDPLFLYTLQITDSEYANLKKEQGLKIDFLSFPNTVLELLKKCCQDQDSSLFECHLLLTKNKSRDSDSSSADFQIIEQNSLRNLTHLCLRVRLANDSEIKRHLVGKMGEYKEMSGNLERDLDEMRARVGDLEKRLLDVRQESEKASSRSYEDFNRMKKEHSEALLREKEHNLLEQRRLQRSFEEESEKKQKSYDSQIQQLNLRIQECLRSSKEVTREKDLLENRIVSLTSKLAQAEEDVGRVKSEQNNELNRDVASLKQQLQHREEILTQMTQLLDSTNAEKGSLEGSNARLKGERNQFGERLTACRQEIKKANQIIQHLQQHLQVSKAKLKKRGGALKKREEQKKDLQCQCGDAVQKSKELEKLAQERQDEIDKLRGIIEEQKKSILENQETLERNGQMISFLQTKRVGDVKGETTASASSYQYRVPFTQLNPDFISVNSNHANKFEG